MKEELEKLYYEVNLIKYTMGDFQDILPIIAVIENDSRDKIIEVLKEKINEYRLKYDAIMDLIKLKTKNDENTTK
jgi:hypothetical protein